MFDLIRYLRNRRRRDLESGVYDKVFIARVPAHVKGRSKCHVLVPVIFFESSINYATNIWLNVDYVANKPRSAKFRKYMVSVTCWTGTASR